MSDIKLMNTTQYDLNALIKQFQLFPLPGIGIKINGAALNGASSTLKASVSSLTVHLTAGLESSACTLVLEDLREESGAGRPLPGSSIQIQAEYPKPISLFEGYISAVTFSKESGDPPLTTLDCLDLKGLMMHGRFSGRGGQINCLAAVESILDQYGKFSVKRDIQASSLNMPLMEQESESDYDFICRVANSLDMEFFILQGIVCLRKPMTVTVPTVVLNNALVILSFSKEVCLSGQYGEVRVVSPGAGHKRASVAAFSDAAKTGGRQTAAGIFAQLGVEAVHTSIEPWIGTKAQAAERAAAIARRQSMKFVTGKCHIIGIPILCPGRFIEFSGIAAELDGVYYMTAVHHMFNQNGFTTSFEFAADSV
jgi:phage protein D